MFGGYSYIEYDIKNSTFQNQLIEKNDIAEEDSYASDFYALLKDCDKITNKEEIMKYFTAREFDNANSSTEKKF